MGTIFRVSKLVLAITTLFVAWSYKEAIWISLQFFVVGLCVVLALFAAVGIISHETIDQVGALPDYWRRGREFAKRELEEAKQAYEEAMKE